MILEEQELTNKVIGNILIGKQPWKLFLLILSGSIFLVLIVLALSLISSIPVGTFTRDPLQIVDAPFYTGILSNLGILFWSAASSVCLFSYFTIRTSHKSEFLLFSGIFTVAVLLDDFFLLHEIVYRNFLHIPQKIVFTGYLIIIIYLILRFRKVIYDTEFIFLLFALILFLFSGILDAVPQNIIPFHHLFEDGSKLIGIVFWLVYYLRTSFSFINLERNTIME